MLSTPTRALAHGLRLSPAGSPTPTSQVLLAVSPSIGDPTQRRPAITPSRSSAPSPYHLKEGPAHWDNIKERGCAGQSELAAAVFAEPHATTRSWRGWWRVRSIWSVEIRTTGRAPATAAPRTRRRLARLRPAAGWAQHRMPIQGLYQTGSTTHPGGSISGGPGRNAAAVMLKDFGRSLDEVVAQKGTRAKAGVAALAK
jgi:phytoene dehydrogenase-like protein